MDQLLGMCISTLLPNLWFSIIIMAVLAEICSMGFILSWLLRGNVTPATGIKHVHMQVEQV